MTKQFDRDEAVRLHNAGLTAAQIAARLGCTIRTVVRIRGEKGLSQARYETACSHVSQDRLTAARELLSDGASWHEVQRTLRMHQRTIAKYFPGTAWTGSQGASFANAVSRLEREIAERWIA